MTDRRIEKSREAIHQAFIGLLQEKHYDEIYIREIAERANIVSRTFYHHYKDKDDLAKQVMSAMLRGTVNQLDQATDLATIEANNLLVLKLATTRQWFVNSLRNHISLPDLLKVAMPFLEQEARRVFADRHAQGSGKVPLDLVAQHFSFSMLSMVYWWLDQGMTIPVEEMASLMSELVIRPLWDKLA